MSVAGGSRAFSLPAAATPLLLLALAAVLVLPAAAVGSGFSCRPGSRPVLFNFGDSNSDTGGMAAARGWHLTRPEGRAFFPRPTGRFCDGRLTIDFLWVRGDLSPSPGSRGNEHMKCPGAHGRGGGGGRNRDGK